MTKQSQDIHIRQNAFNQKGNSNYCYQATDISTIQGQIMAEYSDRFRIHEPIGDNTSAASVLRELVESLEETRLTLCIYNLGNWHWVIFATLMARNQITVL